MTRADQIAKSVADIHRRINNAAMKVGPASESVELVAVSKRFPVADIVHGYSAGVKIFGESRPQELDEKINAIDQERNSLPGIQFHMIGHLQRNKVKLVVNRCALIHSIDSVRLAEAVDSRAADQGIRQPVLLQVNISDEVSKFGLDPESLLSELPKLASMQNLQVRGLMGMAQDADDPEVVRQQFRLLRELRDKAEGLLAAELPALSMGMSNDFEIAVEEGATLVRVGSLIFGDRTDG